MYKKVEVVIEELGLTACADTLIGDEMIRGISGGEKRRTCIGVELVADCDILFLDEPTSGLDSYAAETVVNSLNSLARARNRVIIFSIHQPSSDIVQTFDDILLLADGRLMYYGQYSNSVDWFATFGLNCPTYSNPTDYFLRVNSTTSRGR